MSKDLKSIIDGLKIRDPYKKQVAKRIVRNYSDLPQELRLALVPTLKEISEDKDLNVHKMKPTDVSIHLFHGLTPIRSHSDVAIGVILVLLAFIGGVVNIPSFLLLPAESIYQRIIWRYSVLALFVTPRFIFDVLINITSIWDIFIVNVFPIFFLSLLNTAYVYMVYYAAQHTFVQHALLLSSIGSTFTAAWKIVRREPYTSLEYIGIGLNVFGAYLCCCESQPLERKEILSGNCIAILSSAVHAIYASFSRSTAVMKSCPISVYLMLMSGYIVGLSFLLAFSFGERIDIFSTDDRYGLFAFITTRQSFIYGFVGLGVMAGFMYHYFTLIAQQYIGSLFISISYNLIPLVAQLTAYALSAQDAMAGTFTAIGTVVLFAGCTMLAMNYQDQQYMAHIPLVAKAEEELELPDEVMRPPIEPDYAQSSEL